jgi:hypothetical protein
MPLTLPVKLLKEFMSDTFVETGSARGSGIQAALNAGFTDIYSIEKSKYYFDECSLLFSNNPKVKLYLGDSKEKLSHLVRNIKGSITFWLDAHLETDSPILEELEQISRLNKRDHVIFIDDIRVFGVNDGFPKLVDVLEKIRTINNNYIIEYRDSLLYSGDILVAHTRKEYILENTFDVSSYQRQLAFA